MTAARITVEIDGDRLAGYSDAHLATCWHVAQANPAPFGDKTAGELVERIAREIVRRWLRDVDPELWHHQGVHHYRHWLTQVAVYEPGGPSGTPEWNDGVWVAKPAEPDAGDTTGEATA